MQSVATGEYLNIVKDGSSLKLQWRAQQALQLEDNGDGRVLISREIDGAKYRVRYTNSGGGGWQAAEWSAVNTSQFEVHVVGQAPSQELGVQKINAQDMQVGETYVFAFDGIDSSELRATAPLRYPPKATATLARSCASM